MATKTQDTINALANGIINYINVMVSNAPFVLTDLGKVKAVTLTNGKYLHTVTIRNFDYVGIKSMGNNEFPVGSVVYILVPNRQYNQMFILGHCDDTNANIKGGNINLGNGNFVVDNSGNVTIKTGSINLGNGNFVVDDDGNVTIKSGSINIGSGNFAVNSTGKVTIKSGSINIGSGNFTVDASGKMTAKSGYIGDSSNGFTIGNTYIYNGTNSMYSTTRGIYLGTDGINLGFNFRVDSGGFANVTSMRLGHWLINETDINSKNIMFYQSASNFLEVGKIYGETGGTWGNGGILGMESNGLRFTANNTYGMQLKAVDCSITLNVVPISPNVPTTGTILFNGYTYNKCLLQTNTTSNGNYRVLYGESTSDSTLTEGARKGGLFYNPSLHRLYIGGSATGAMLEYPSAQTFYLRASNEANYGVNVGVVDNIWSLAPIVNDKMALGSPAYKWKQLYAISGTINTSDRNEKKDIEILDNELSERFLMSLNPVSYKFINGESGRTHYGFIAQDVEDTLNSLGLTAMDFAGFCKDQKTREVETVRYTEDGYEIIDEYGNVETNIHQEPIPNEYSYGLRYEEFIPLCVKMIQMQQLRIEELERKVSNGN